MLVTGFHPNHAFHTKVLVRLQAEARWEMRGSSALIRKDQSQVAVALVEKLDELWDRHI